MNHPQAPVVVEDRKPSSTTRSGPCLGCVSVLLVLAAVLMIACSSDEGSGSSGRAPTETSADALSSWNLHLYAGPSPSWTRIDLAPPRPYEHAAASMAQLVGLDAASSGETSGAASEWPSISPSAVVDAQDGGVEFDQFEESRPSSSRDGFLLLWAAAAECGMVNQTAGMFGALPRNDYVQWQQATVPPWMPTGKGRAWYIFASPPISCSQNTAYQETLLCIAQRLSDAADLVAPERWDGPAMVSKPPDGYPRGPYTIPPQRSADRFILRTMAQNVLAHLALFDTTWPTAAQDANQRRVCSTLYREALQSPNLTPTQRKYLFAYDASQASAVSHYFDDPPLNVMIPGDVRKMIRTRMLFQAHILRSAARLSKHLTETSVFADLAGTEQRRAAETDPLRGAKIAWGLPKNDELPYNTLSHAVRVIAGRWEMGPNSPDPVCGGVPAWNLLQEAYGSAVGARVEDKSSTSEGQTRAVQLIEANGIVLPQTALENAGPPALRAAVREQVLINAAMKQGISPSSSDFHDFVNKGQGKALEAALADVTDGDLRFALNRSLGKYRMLTSTAKDVDVSVARAGLPQAANVSGVAALGGTVLAGGMPTQDLSTDILSQAAGILEASQCAVPLAGEVQSDLAVGTPFQDSFSLGQSLYRRLVVLREETKTAGLDGEDGSAWAVANTASAEVRAWSAEGRVAAMPVMSGLAVREVQIGLLGLTLAELGVANVQEAASQIALAYGPAWVADCATKQRSSCPADFELTHMASASSIVTEPTWTSRLTGFDGTPLAMTFRVGPEVSQFNPRIVGSATSDRHLYVILRSDPDHPSRGKVLAALALRRPNWVTSAPVSEFQRRLLNDVLGIGTSFSMNGGLVGIESLAHPLSYCIPDAPRGLFVPLESELTSDSDMYENSWRHYLNLAQNAAARADQLADKLIELGFQKDLRREAAGEELASLCGSYGSLDETKFEDGKVIPPADDEGMTRCLEEETVDIVFLTEDQTENGSGVTPYKVLGCPGSGNGLCITPESEIKTDGLNITTSVRPTLSNPQTCENAIGVLESLRTGYDPSPLDAVLSEGWMTVQQAETLLRGIHWESNGLHGWKLKLAGETVMNSEQNADQRWPGCYWTATPLTNPQGDCDPDDPSVDAFDRIFRVRGGPLGQGGVTPEQELAMIRWRVEGAIWTLASMAGIVPAYLFNVQVPAVNFAKNPEIDAPIPTIYGHGRFVLLPSGAYRLTFPDVDDDNTSLIDAWALDQSPYPDNWVAVPRWIRDVYADHENYLHTAGSIPDVKLEAVADLGSFVREVTGGFRSMVCTSGGMIVFEGEGMAGERPLVSYDLLANQRSSKGGWGQLCHTPKATYRPTLAVRAFPDPAGLGVRVAVDLRDRLEVEVDTDPMQMQHGWDAFARRDVRDIVPGFVPKASSVDGVLQDRLFFPFIGWMALGMDEDFGGVTPLACKKWVVGSGTTTLNSTCVEDAADAKHYVYDSSVGVVGGVHSYPYRYTHRMLRPLYCGPSKRVAAFVNSYPPTGTCGAAAQMSQAIAFACELHHGGIFVPPTEPPTVTRPEHVAALGRWTHQQALRASQVVSSLYLENIPTRVIADIRSNKVGTGSKEGEHGRVVLQMGSAIRQIESHWQRVSLNLSMMGTAVDSLNTSLAAAQIYEDQELARLAIQRMQVHQSMIAAAANAVSTLDMENAFRPVGAAAQTAAAIATIAIGRSQLGKLDELETLAGKQNANMMAQAFIDFERTAQPLYADLENGLRDIQIAVADTLMQASLLRQNQSRAAYQAAKGAGEDFVMIDGKAVGFPVNTVLNRQYDITKERYHRALHEAKYLAYIARLAIEQRIGMRLNTLVERVGPLEAPATWADDVCSLQGVDYERLRGWGNTDVESDGGVSDLVLDEYSKQIVAEFADAYIGDYVSKLGNFVDYYNIQYPSHDGDDTAVLSLREDFLPGSGACVRNARNELFFSDQLDTNQSVPRPDEEPELRGWQLRGCGTHSNRCLLALKGSALPAPRKHLEPANANVPPSEDGQGGVTWLREDELSTVLQGQDAEIPSRIVWQAVTLEPGTYVLSWRDQARSRTGYVSLYQGDAVSVPSTLRVGLYDESWNPVRAQLNQPHIAQKLHSVWSPRRMIEATVSQAGTYHVAFGISLQTESPGSVAIANVQLERVSGAGSSPSAYVSTGVTRSHLTSDCDNLSADELRAAFRYQCDQAGWCFYELVQPMTIDTSSLGSASSYLNGKLASDNFNLRHITVALNLVGTGIRDCEDNSGMACYGAGFVEYTLRHDAFQSGIVGWNGEEQYFNFGSAAINHGKALASERYITLPIGSGDGALLGQPGIEKSEFRGRPLDGSYRLRIWDDGSLRWDRLEDVQVVLKYRYWSAIDAQP